MRPFFVLCCPGVLMVAWGTGCVADASGASVAESIRLAIGAAFIALGVVCCVVAILERGR